LDFLDGFKSSLQFDFFFLVQFVQSNKPSGIVVEQTLSCPEFQQRLTGIGTSKVQLFIVGFQFGQLFVTLRSVVDGFDGMGQNKHSRSIDYGHKGTQF
jgi:hypothetical protein